MQVGGTLCNLQCTHCFISCGPQNHTHEMMTLGEVQARLDESKTLGVKDYYITGGEVFINPEIFEILEAILQCGPLDVLTNGTLITPEKAKRLQDIQARVPIPCSFASAWKISMKRRTIKCAAKTPSAAPWEASAIWRSMAFRPY